MSNESQTDFLFYLLFAIIIASIASVTVVRYFPPLQPKIVEPFNVSDFATEYDGTNLIVSFNISSCYKMPKQVILTIETVNRTPLMYNTLTPTCGLNTVAFPINSYLFDNPAVYSINASFDNGTYFVGFFENYINFKTPVSSASFTYNGTPFIVIRYNSSYPAVIYVKNIYIINIGSSSQVFSNCNSTIVKKVTPSINGEVTLPLNCNYSNLEVYNINATYSVRGDVYVSFYTPPGVVNGRWFLIENINTNKT